MRTLSPPKLLVAGLALLAVLAMASFAVAGGTKASAAAKPKKDIVQIAAGDDRFDTLVSLVTSAGLAETLSGKGPYTVFAPTDAAFAKVPPETLEALGNDPDALRNVLLYHVAEGRYPAARVVRRTSIPTLAGPRLSVRASKRVVRVGGARVVDPDVKAKNGVIHAINRVLIPPQQ